MARADGIPLYAVEIVRMLAAQGSLEIADGAYRPVGDLADLAVPETLHSLIAARLDALEPADRALLQAASVLGHAFTVDGLAAVAATDAGDVERRLTSLVRRELVVRDVDPRSAERGQFAFVQSLVREVAYSTLSRRDRKARHLAAARYLRDARGPGAGRRAGDPLPGGLPERQPRAPRRMPWPPRHGSPSGPRATGRWCSARRSRRSVSTGTRWK